MMHARNVTGQAARGWAIAAALLAAGSPLGAQAQAPQAAPAAATPAPAAPAGPRPMSESVAAVVNDEIISTYDLAQRMRLLIYTSQIQPTQENLPQFQHEALVSLVDEHLQLQELRRVEKEQKFSIVLSDKEVDNELAGMAKQNNMTLDQFMNVLRAQGINPDTLRQEIRAQVSWDQWVHIRWGSRLRVGEDQIKATQARLNAAASKPQYEISEVLIDAGRVGGMKAAEDGAKQLIAQLQQGAPFAAVARQFSASPTAANGGDAGWVSEGELAPEVRAAVEQLRPGQLSQPIPVKDGVYIIYLRDKRSGAGATLVHLKQAAVALPADAPAADVQAAQAKLEQLRAANPTCDTIDAAASKTQGVIAGDLGEAEINDLAPEFRDAAQSLKDGQLSAPIRTKVGLHVLLVCGRRAGGALTLDHDQIAERLQAQQLSMISRRQMRDLRNAATIETR